MPLAYTGSLYTLQYPHSVFPQEYLLVPAFIIFGGQVEEISCKFGISSTQVGCSTTSQTPQISLWEAGAVQGLVHRPRWTPYWTQTTFVQPMLINNGCCLVLMEDLYEKLRLCVYSLICLNPGFKNGLQSKCLEAVDKVLTSLFDAIGKE